MILNQIHHPFWKGDVGIPYQLAKSLQPTTLSLNFILMVLQLELDSNWNTVQQVRINIK
jgi:hypothetical protein